MDIDSVLGSLEVPGDQPDWEKALLAELDEAPGVEHRVLTVRSFAENRPLGAVILPFPRSAAA